MQHKTGNVSNRPGLKALRNRSRALYELRSACEEAGAGKAASGELKIHLSPSASRRQARLEAVQKERQLYIDLGIIKPVVSQEA